MGDLNTLLSEIAIKRDKLNEMLKHTEDCTCEVILDISRALDELITAYYDLLGDKTRDND